MTKTYSTKQRLPRATDANALGYVHARSTGRIGYDAVRWEMVDASKHDRWSPAADRNTTKKRTGA
jgi:hypothetical protein